jgi:hypothetical protein
MDQPAVDDDLKHPAARCAQLDPGRQFLFQFRRQTGGLLA